MSNRIKEPQPNELSDAQTGVLERLVAGRGRILTPYKVWIHSPDVADPMERLGTYLNKRARFTPREVEITILMVAVHWRAEYVIAAHLRDGAKAGLDGATLETLRNGGRPNFHEPREEAVCAFVGAALAGGAIADNQFASFESVLTRSGVAELLVLIGYYTSVALAMNMHDVPVRD